MLGRPSLKRAAASFAGLAALAILLGGCASADKTPAEMNMSTATTASSTSTSSMSSSSSSSSMIMPTSNSDGGLVTSKSVDGLKAVPTAVLASTTWQGMRITAEARSPVAFLVPNGTSMQEIKPGNASFHLMVMLTDAQTGVPIPYAGVWATVTRAGKIIFDERQWPMISRYMGPHYGNNVTLPSNGAYQLSLLVSPPEVARHLEYANVWLKPHRVDFTFRWKQGY